jgi:hypothetical protein
VVDIISLGEYDGSFSIQQVRTGAERGYPGENRTERIPVTRGPRSYAMNCPLLVQAMQMQGGPAIKSAAPSDTCESLDTGNRRCLGA